VRDDVVRSWPTLGALVLQSLLLAWWLGTLSADVRSTKEQLTIKASTERIEALVERVGRIEDRVQCLEGRN